ncbi:MAG: SDR family oxidoreductase [Nitrososphaerota archaeon]|nr:SDR family oxidoreductase [Nitrososphaerota archaeon]
MNLPSLKLPESLHGLLGDKVGIVTGASRGIGAATAIILAEAGAKITLAARNEKSIESLASKINSSSRGAALAVQTDVTNSSSVQNMVNETVASYGRLDVAFNNAGEGHMPSPLAEIKEGEFEQAVRTNIFGTFLCMKYEIPAMLKSGGGSIVNMSSTAGLEGVKGMAGYAAGKHGVIGLTESAAIDYGRNNIRVNVLAPGPIYTERYAGTKVPEQIAFAVPMGRIGKREEVAFVVTWLCSDLSSFVTGATISIDGGRMAGVWFPDSPRPPS